MPEGGEIGLRRPVDLGLLRAFVAVVDAGGMTAAGAWLSLTQAAVSQQIKRLEEAFGDPLFERGSGRKLALTTSGERLLVYARRMIALDSEMWGAMTAAPFEGEIKLGVPYDIVGAFMPPILRVFADRWPNVRVTLVCKTTKALRADLASGEIDLTLTTEADPADEVLLADPLVWIGAIGGSAHRKDPLPLVLDSEDCMFRAAAVAALTKMGRDWRLTCFASQAAPTLAIISADLAVTVVMRRSIPAGFAIVQSPDLPPLPTYYVNLITPPTGLDGAAAEMARHLRDGFGQVGDLASDATGQIAHPARPASCLLAG